MTDSRSGFGSLHMRRSRGAVCGFFLVVLGAWGALVPFVGPYFHCACPPGQAWVWSTARAWLQVLPGVTAALGGFLLLISGNRATAMLGGWLAAAAGAWFVVGRTLAPALQLGDVGRPLTATDAHRAVVDVASFSGMGALIVLLSGAMLARVTIRTARDVELDQQVAGHPPTIDPRHVDAYPKHRAEVLTSHYRTEAWVVNPEGSQPRLPFRGEARAVRAAADR